MTITYSDGDPKAQTDGALFPDEIEFAPDMLFHGTTSNFEKQIEASGFRYIDDAFDYDDLEFVIETFEKLWWAGTHTDGYSVLASFNRMDFERGGGRKKPSYFAETSLRAALYALKDFAGGETARAVRLAIRDLLAFASATDVRSVAIRQGWSSRLSMFGALLPPSVASEDPSALAFDSLHQLWTAIVAKVPKGCLVEPASDLDWLHGREQRLRAIDAKATALLNQHTHGVVYAVRFDEADLANMEVGAGGIACNAEIPATKIVAKYVFGSEAEKAVFKKYQDAKSAIMFKKMLCADHIANRLRQR